MTLKDFIKVFNNETRFLIMDAHPEDENHSVLFSNVTNNDPVDIDVFNKEFFKEYNNVVMAELIDILYDAPYIRIYVTK